MLGAFFELDNTGGSETPDKGESRGERKRVAAVAAERVEGPRPSRRTTPKTPRRRSGRPAKRAKRC